MLTNSNKGRVIIRYTEPGFAEPSVVDFASMDDALSFVEANSDIVCILYSGKFYFLGL